MARIPTSRGRSTPGAVQTPFTPITGLSKIGETFDQLKQNRDAEAQQQEASAKAYEVYRANVDEADAKSKVDDVLTTEVVEQVTKLRNDVGNGVLTAEDAKAQLQKFGDERWKTLSSDVPLFAQGKIQDTWNSAIGKQGAGFLPFEIKATEQKAYVVLEREATTASRMGNRANGLAHLDNALARLPIPEAKKAETRLNWNIDADKNEAIARINNAFQSGNGADLDAVVADLDKPDVYKYLPQDQARNLKATALSRKSTLIDRQQIEANARENEAEKLLNNFKQQVFTGAPLSTDLVQNTATALKGTSYESEFMLMRDQSTKMQEFARLPTAQQAQLLNGARADMATTGSSDPVEQKKLFEVYQSIHTGKLTTLRNNPKLALAEKGIEVPELNSMEMRNNPKNFAEKVLQTGSKLYALQQIDPNAKMQVFDNAEIAGFRQTFEAMPVTQKLDFIGQLVTQSQNVKGGSKIFGSTLGQLGNGALSYVMAGLAKAQNLRSKEGAEVASMIVQGQEVVKSKSIKMPDLKGPFNNYVGNSVTGNSANMLFDATKAIYAHLMTQDGKVITGDPISNDNETFLKAASLATGGVYKQEGGYSGYGVSGYKVSKPYGMDDGTFESKLDVAYQDAAKRTGLSADDLQDFIIERAPTKTPDGFVQYFMRDARGNYVRDKDRRNVALIMRGVRK